MKHLTTGLALTLASAATADIRSEADALIAQAFLEHRVLVSCSEQTPDLMNLFVDWMPTTLEDARPQMNEIGYSPEEIETLLDAAIFDNIRLPDTATVGELRALCALDPDWARKFKFMENVILREDLQELIDSQ